jgi:hypothetical protein
MTVVKVAEYIREDGSNPFKAWFDDLDAQAAAKVATATLRLEMGNTSNVKWIGTIGDTGSIGGQVIGFIWARMGWP